MIPPKLVKIAAHILCSPLPKAINKSLLQGVFPDDAKIALDSPLNKRTSKKKDSNYRPTTFSKIYKKVAKRSLEEDVTKSLSPFLPI